MDGLMLFMFMFIGMLFMDMLCEFIDMAGFMGTPMLLPGFMGMFAPFIWGMPGLVFMGIPKDMLEVGRWEN